MIPAVALKSKAVSKLVALAVIVFIVAAVAMGYFLFQPKPTTTTDCLNCFIQQPVVDVIIPELASQTDQNGGVNVPLNATSGETSVIHVVVYSEQAVNVTLSFKSFISGSNESQLMTAAFSPSTLVVPKLGNATSVVHIFISPSVANGTYTAVISAVASQNSSWVWGDYFKINVTS